MNDKFLERWANNIKMWRKQKLPIKEMLERTRMLTEEQREAVRVLLMESNNNNKEGTTNEPTN